MTPAEYNQRTGLAILCPVTSQVKGYPFEVALPSGLAIGGVVLADQAKSIDWRARRAEVVATAPDDVILQVWARLAVLLDPTGTS
jgi:mRNA interferase MazF